MRNPILTVTIAFVLAVPCTALGGDKGKQRNIELNDYGFGVSMPVTTSRSDGGGTPRDVPVTKKFDKSSPVLMMQSSSPGGGGKTKAK